MTADLCAAVKHTISRAAGEPEIPDCARYLWEWFAEIVGPEPLNHREIMAWADLTGVRLTPWEARTLMAMERIRATTKPAEARMVAPSAENTKSLFRGLMARKNKTVTEG